MWSSGLQVGALVGLAACTQRHWDGPVVGKSCSRLLESLSDVKERARLLAVSAPTSSAWLQALRIASCDLRLDDEAARIAGGGLTTGEKAMRTP